MILIGGILAVVRGNMQGFQYLISCIVQPSTSSEKPATQSSCLHLGVNMTLFFPCFLVLLLISQKLGDGKMIFEECIVGSGGSGWAMEMVSGLTYSGRCDF